MKQIRFRHQPVDVIPESLEAHVLYVTRDGDVAAHLCACGCGKEVITPLAPTDWTLSFEKRGGATLDPSIGNWAFPCRSHYFIWGGAVVWARGMSEKAIAAGRSRDRARKQKYYEQRKSIDVPRRSSQPDQSSSDSVHRLSIWERLLTWLRSLVT
ncbi:DUF6527 family protein [Roseateles amylovorans]|uniref:DUF6527 family protein n=1 Tax=Roseateles amylovorans TaxID=2978473 RepID=A0ABY6B0X7_9BURK|nr:DUF6527 family protein [Roseateles amylovorans]UXH79051.1 DUF6527 family protein [Roseateles amylovorans]